MNIACCNLWLLLVHAYPSLLRLPTAYFMTIAQQCQRSATRDTSPPKLHCPENPIIDKIFDSASSEVSLNLPKIQITGTSNNIQLVYQPQNGTIIELDKPIKINVTAIDSNGNMGHCQFWFTAMTADCPLWKIDSSRFSCRREGNISVCYPQSKCKSREIPPNIKAIVCVPGGNGWRLIEETDVVITHLSNAKPMISSPVCLDEISSSVTLALIYTYTRSSVPCNADFLLQMSNVLDSFLNHHCSDVGWTFSGSAQSEMDKKLQLNFTTHNTNTKEVLDCIQEITGKLPVRVLQCMNGPVFSTVLYHLKCPIGWGANDALKCEKCPAGFYVENSSCVRCPVGFYSNREESQSCSQCPENTSTKFKGSASEHDCVDICGPGYFSADGLAPCIACKIGSFQPETHQRSCIKCAFNRTTLSAASKTANECQIDCPSGSFGINGICRSCPLGFYQDNPGSSTCNKCPKGKSTQSVGANSISQCLDQSCNFIGCKNGGSCESNQCLCQQGFTGINCGVPIDICDTAYCLNGAICMFNADIGSTCVCQPNTNGKRCEHVSELNQSTMVSRSKRAHIPTENFKKSTFSTTITASTSPPTSTSTLTSTSTEISWGDTSTAPASPFVCELNDCPNGNCNGKTCNCNIGYDLTAGRCVKKEMCEWDTCDWRHTSRLAPGDACCYCELGYTGKYCERSKKCDCVQASDCPQNGDNTPFCFFKDNTNSCGSCYYKCHNNYWLQSCDQKPDKVPKEFTCTGVNCNGGECKIDDLGIPYCECKDQSFIGENCEKQVSRCSIRNPNFLKCKNGGRCREENGVAKCICPEGLTGETCDKLIDSCTPNPCGKGKCTPLFNETYSCQCDEGVFGKNCDELIDPCKLKHQVCGNGKCLSKSYGYDADVECTCNEGWDKNSNCFAPVDLCSENDKCKNGGVCKMNGVGNFACLCANNGFKDKFCDVQIDYCQPNPCLNSGNCVQSKADDGKLTFKCECNGQYSGDNCELLTDPCSNVVCKHNGVCNSWGSYWNCTCVGKYSGQYCEISPSLCDDPKYCNNNGQCVRDKDGFDYCNCNVGWTGLRCETQKTENFNLHFTGIKVVDNKKQHIYAQTEKYQFKNQLTLCAWIKYEVGSKNSGPFVILSYSSDKIVWLPMFWMSNSGVATSGNLLVEYNMNENQWYHVAIICNLNDNTLTLRVNGNIVKTANFILPSIDSNFRVIVGEQTNGDQTFVGELSLVQLFDHSFTSEDFSEMLVNCPSFAQRPQTDLVISWRSYTTIDQYNYAVIVSMPGICVTSTCLVGRSDCSPEHDKIPPTVVNCPLNQYKISDTRLTVVEWPEVTFTDDNIILSVDSNFRNGQLFSWGIYHVVYLATDRAQNTAICEFDVIVSPQQCANPIATDTINVNNTPIIDPSNLKEQIKMMSVIWCSNEGYVFTQDHPPFYVCDLMGQWDRFAYLGNRFNLPSCSSTVNPLQIVKGNLGIQSCEFVNDFRNKIRDSILAALKTIKFCDDPNCTNELTITDDCKEKNELRLRRQSMHFEHFESATFTVSYQLNITNTPYSVQTALNETFDSTFGNNNKPNIKTNFDCTQSNYPQFRISPDQENADNDKNLCATCAAGEYYDDTKGACAPCPLNTYKPFEGTGKCMKCPDGKVTTGTGSVNEIDCYLNCPPGQFFKMTENKCELCPLGTYMPDYGRLKCTACPLQSTTANPGAKSKSDCNVKCNAGSELSAKESCEKCAEGLYRTDNMETCKKCNRGFSTNEPGGDSPRKCNLVVCPPGHHGKQDQEPVNQETATFDQVCVQCDYGYYQPEEHQLSCIKCPDDKSTVERGATSVDYCSLKGSLSCTPSQPNCPDDMQCVLTDSGGYECRKIGISNDKISHPIQPWIWLVITSVLIIVVLVLLFLTILYRGAILRFLDERFPGLLRCFELKEGGRRFSLDPTRDTNNLPFTPDDGIHGGTIPTDSTQQTNADELDRESWSTSDSVPDSTPRWSTRRSENPRNHDNYAEDPNLNTDSIDTLNEIRSGLIEVMDYSESVKSDSSSHCTSPLPPILNPGLRVETRPPAFVGLTHRRQSLTRQQSDGLNETQLTQSNAYYGHQISSRFNKSGRSYAWTNQYGRGVPPETMSYSDTKPQSIKSSSAHNDDDNDFFC